MPAYIEVPLTFEGHSAHLYVTLAGGGGYDVSVKVDQREIAQKHCNDWRRVEKFRVRVQQWLASPGADSAAHAPHCSAA